jgi:integrase
MNHIHTLLKNVFQKAIDYDIIYKNPCAHVTTPRRNDPNRRSLSAEEGIRLMQEVNDAEEAAYQALDAKEQRMEHIGKNKNRAFVRGVSEVGNIIAVRIGLATGMRRGEVFGLVWKNVDLEELTIRVCQSLTAKNTIKVPKTNAGIRTVAIDDDTAAHLATWKRRQAEELAKLGLHPSGETAVCCSDVGGFYNVDNFERWWDPWRKEHGFEGPQVPRAQAHAGHAAFGEQGGREDRADQAGAREPRHHARLVRPRDTRQRPRGRADARKPLRWRQSGDADSESRR